MLFFGFPVYPTALSSTKYPYLFSGTDFFEDFERLFWYNIAAEILSYICWMYLSRLFRVSQGYVLDHSFRGDDLFRAVDEFVSIRAIATRGRCKRRIIVVNSKAAVLSGLLVLFASHTCSVAAINLDDFHAYWPFDGDFLDYSGNSVDGSEVGGPQFVPGRIGQAIDIDSTSGEYINLGVSDIAPPWSVSLWAKRTGDNTAAAILDSPAYSLRLEQWPDTHQVGVTEYGLVDHVFSYSAPLNTWVHLVYIGDGSAVSLYADGSYIGNVSTATAMACPMNTIGKLTDTLVAVLDDVAVINRILSGTEVLDIYN